MNIFKEENTMVYQHILLASDLYAENEHFSKKALELANAFKAKLSIVHVVEHPYVYATYFAPFPDVEVEINAQAKVQLEKLGEKLDVPVSDQHLCSGAAKAEVLQLADKINADLIVVGSHVASVMGHLLGSTASAVVNGAKIDVLTIRK
jgi:universal stress protein A